MKSQTKLTNPNARASSSLAISDAKPSCFMDLDDLCYAETSSTQGKSKFFRLKGKNFSSSSQNNPHSERLDAYE